MRASWGNRLARSVWIIVPMAGLFVLSACGETECPPNPRVDLAYLAEQWDARSPLDDWDGRECMVFNVQNTGVTICEYDDPAELDAAVGRGAQNPAGTALTVDGLDSGVRPALDKLSALSNECGQTGTAG